MPEAVIFDCDGVLVDSEELAWEAWRRTLDLYGVAVGANDVRSLTGKAQPDVYAAFATRAALPPYSVLYDRVSAVLFELFERHLDAFADARSAVQDLRELGMPLAVASSSPRTRLDRTLAAVGLETAFKTTVAGDEVARGKPAPDLFDEAARSLGVDAAGCTAVEDSPAGISSAKASGMTVIAVSRGHFHPSELSLADKIVDSLSARALVSVH